MAVTGIAGPGGGTEEKPVGTVWLAARAGEREKARRVWLPGDRAAVRERTAQAAIKMLLNLVVRERGVEPEPGE